MDEPSEQDQPKHAGEDELNQRHEHAPLDELTEPWNKKATERRDHVTG